ncbi:MAG: GNAT family N-acetyltransferase [Cyanobacteria bacterium P01_A01_bin.17]
MRTPAFDQPGFQLRLGRSADQALLLTFMQKTYREAYPQCQIEHLAETVSQYWSKDSPVWFVASVDAPAVACLWLGRAIDQVTGEHYTHVLLLYVMPAYRRQGIGTALMRQAEAWAKERRDRKLGLQVFEASQPAQALYAHLGYTTHARTLIKSLQS